MTVGEFVWRYRVAFSETDLAGIVHFSNYLRYMENAEHAMFRDLGYSIHDPDPHGLRWPRVHVSCDYKKPLRFEDEVALHLFVVSRRQRTVEYLFAIKKVNDGTSELVAVGKVIAVCCQHLPGDKLKAIAIPGPLATALQPAEPSRYQAYLKN